MKTKYYHKFLWAFKRLLQAFGLFPAPLGYYKNFRKLSGKSLNDSSNYVYWSFFLIVVWISSWIVIGYFQAYIFYDRSSVGKINDILKFSTVSLACMVAIIEMIINREKLKTIHIKIMRFERICSVLKIDWKKYNDACNRSFAILVFFTLSIYLAIEIKIVLAIGPSKQWSNFWMVGIIPITMCRLTYLQFLDYMSMVKTRLQMLIDKLKIIVEQSELTPLSSSKESYIAYLKQIEAIKDGYGSLWDISNDINDCFAWSMAGNITQNFVQIACDMYWTYVQMILFKENITGLLLIFNFIKILLIY